MQLAGIGLGLLVVVDERARERLQPLGGALQLEGQCVCLAAELRQLRVAAACVRVYGRVCVCTGASAHICTSMSSMRTLDFRDLHFFLLFLFFFLHL